MKLIPIKAGKLKVGQECYSTPDEESQGDRVMGKTIHIITKDGCIQHAFPTDTVYVEAEEEKKTDLELTREIQQMEKDITLMQDKSRGTDSQATNPSVYPTPPVYVEAEETDVVEASRIPIATWFEFVNDRGEGKCVVVSQRPRDDYEVQYISTRLCGVERCMGTCLVRRIPNPIEAGQKAIEQRDKLVAAMRDRVLRAAIVYRWARTETGGIDLVETYSKRILAKAGIPEVKP